MKNNIDSTTNHIIRIGTPINLKSDKDLPSLSMKTGDVDALFAKLLKNNVKIYF